MLPQVNGDFVAVSEPELRFTGDGKPWAKVRAVAKDRRKNQQGEWEDGETCFIDIVVYGKVAENVTESITKGDPMVVTGRLLMREWETSEGRKVTGYSIKADEIGPSLKFRPSRTDRAASEQRPSNPVQQSDDSQFAPF